MNNKINYLIYILAIIYLIIPYKQNTSNHKNHMNHTKSYEILQFKGDLLAYLPGKYFSLYGIIKKHWLHIFLPKPSLGNHTTQGRLFCLNTPLIYKSCVFKNMGCYCNGFSICCKISWCKTNAKLIKQYGLPK